MADPERQPLLEGASSRWAPAARFVGAALGAVAVLGLSSSSSVRVGATRDLGPGRVSVVEELRESRSGGEPTAVDAPADVPGDELVLTALTKTDAACMDGSVPMYYYAPATTNPSTWLVELNEGGFCFSAASCAARTARAQTGDARHMYVGSAQFPRTWVREGSLLYDDPEDSPLDLRGAHRVLLGYCTADLHLGRRSAPTADGVGPQMGAAVVDALLDDLAASRGLGDATTFVLVGSSAGAAGVAVAYPHVAERVRAAAPEAQVVGLFDSDGLFAEAGEALATKAAGLWDLADVDAPSQCTSRHPGAEWKCLIFTHLYDAGVFDGLPFLVTQFQRDQFQLRYLAQNDDSETTDDVALAPQGVVNPSYKAFLETTHAFLERIAGDVADGKTDAGVFAPRGVGHIFVNAGPYVYSNAASPTCTVDGVTARAFINNYLARFIETRPGAATPAGPTILIDDDVAAPSGDDDAALAADLAGKRCGGYASL